MLLCRSCSTKGQRYRDIRVQKLWTLPCPVLDFRVHKQPSSNVEHVSRSHWNGSNWRRRVRQWVKVLFAPRIGTTLESVTQKSLFSLVWCAFLWINASLQIQEYLVLLFSRVSSHFVFRSVSTGRFEHVFSTPWVFLSLMNIHFKICQCFFWVRVFSGLIRWKRSVTKSCYWRFYCLWILSSVFGVLPCYRAFDYLHQDIQQLLCGVLGDRVWLLQFRGVVKVLHALIVARL